MDRILVDQKHETKIAWNIARQGLLQKYPGPVTGGTRGAAIRPEGWCHQREGCGAGARWMRQPLCSMR